MPQSYFIIEPVSSAASVTSGVMGPRSTAAAAVKSATVPTRRISSAGRNAASGAVPAPVASRARAALSLPSATATNGKTPAPAVTVTSYRSPIPSSSASTSTGSTGKPSVWVTVIRCPARATRNAVSAPALMMRSLMRWPGLALKTVGAAGIRPLARK